MGKPLRDLGVPCMTSAVEDYCPIPLRSPFVSLVAKRPAPQAPVVAAAKWDIILLCALFAILGSEARTLVDAIPFLLSLL